MNYRRYKFDVPFGAIAENLVNTLDESISVPEHLVTPADVGKFLHVHAIEWPRKPAVADLEALRVVRARVRALFVATTQTEAERRLNELLVDARVNLRVARERGVARIEWAVDDSVELAEAVRSATAVSAAHIAKEFGFERLRVCGADPCADVFLDASKRGEQRFCGSRCATRVRVAAHRARQ
ncbi:MAG: CGNR zinc finger domain-containing protein [Steroidobacteraceae bacterium]|nr:CGNR zinc finger domain-containing protein [Steroidobacteraceae bacterium]